MKSMDSIYKATRFKNDELEYLKKSVLYKHFIKLINSDVIINYNEIVNMNLDFTYLRILLKYYSDKLINKKFRIEIMGSYTELTFLTIITSKFRNMDEFEQAIELYYKYGEKYKNTKYTYTDCHNICISLYFKTIYSRIFVQYWLKGIFRKIYQKRIIYIASLLAKSNIKLSDDIINEFVIFKFESIFIYK